MDYDYKDWYKGSEYNNDTSTKTLSWPFWKNGKHVGKRPNA
jgi:ribulose bisphosphate carboxylase small subunit